MKQKVTACSILALSFLLIVVALIQNSNQKSVLRPVVNKEEPTQVSKTTPTPEEKIPAIISMVGELDPSGKFAAEMSYLKAYNESVPRLYLNIFARKQFEDAVIPLVTGSNLSSLWSVVLGDESQAYLRVLNKYFHYDSSYRIKGIHSNHYHNFYEWSNKGTILAFLLPDEIIMLSFDYLSDGKYFYEINSSKETVVDYKTALKVKDYQEIEIPNMNWEDLAYNFSMFFSGDDRYLYVIQGESVFFRYDTLRDKVEDLIIPGKERAAEYLEIYPVPGSPGYSYWVHGHYQKNSSVVTSDGTTEKEFSIPDSKGIDGLGKILFSPGRDKVCLEWGASGYWGYVVYEFPPGRLLDSGQQYSYCRRWLDDNRLVIIEDPYHEVGSYWFELNVATGEKKLLDEVGKEHGGLNQAL
ncbi:MAG TPA: hypothetical protein VMW41_03360 [Candidatus Bathyarchaeia archaeon]|nr:hypothetical protein [Candidatus Bathyarchaeia archaeon]